MRAAQVETLRKKHDEAVEKACALAAHMADETRRRARRAELERAFDARATSRRARVDARAQRSRAGARGAQTRARRSVSPSESGA